MRSGTLLAAALLAVAVSRPGPALAARPDLAFAVGTTAAVEGEPGDGGPSLSVAMLWPVEDRFRIGVMALADDLGQEHGRLLGPGDVDLGPIAGMHRSTLGAVWRMEAHVPTAGTYDPFLVATWGAYRVNNDLRGVSTSRFAAAGFGLGAGFARRLSDMHAVGVTARYQQLSRGAGKRYLSAAVEWRWRGSATD